jgi:hypothetical protein
MTDAKDDDLELIEDLEATAEEAEEVKGGHHAHESHHGMIEKLREERDLSCHVKF